MNEEVKLYLDDAKEKMDKALKHYEHTLATLRAGKADPNILSSIHVDYYGAMSPLSQVANISIPDVKSIVVQPWDKSMLDVIEKAILQANIGITPIINGDMIRLNIPPLTEERRKELVRQVKQEGENTKIAVRNIRRDINEELKTLKKDGLAEDLFKEAEHKVQEMTDSCIKKVDEMISKKEKDIMTV
mgnify:CR=1 FL=1